MKIVRPNAQETTFEEIKVGEFFEYQNTVFLKLSNREDADNAFDCTHNEPDVFINKKCGVTSLTVKVVIE